MIHKSTALYVVVSVVVVSSSAFGTLIMGTNAVLDNPANDFYIPQKGATSGTLGDPLGGGKYVGLNADTLTLSGTSSSTGYVEFDFRFDTSALAPGEQISLNGATLVMTFDDIDFKPYNIHSRWPDFHESLDLELGVGIGKPVLTIDESNYGHFTDGLGFVPTNNKTVVYKLNLKDDLGLTAGDLTTIDNDGGFDLHVKFKSHLNHTGSSGPKVRNTPEDVAGSIMFNTVPEPTTLLILAAGSLFYRRGRK